MITLLSVVEYRVILAGANPRDFIGFNKRG